VSAGAGFAFGPYRLDVRVRQLLLDGRPLSLSEREFHVLHALVGRAGTVVSKNELVDIGWNGDAATDNSIAHVIVRLRRLLDDDDANRYIRNKHGRGYVFVAPVELLDAPQDEVDIDALIGPYRALRSGRAAIETLERASIERARATFERVLAQHDGEAAAHVGMANACAFQFEATRADATPDLDSLHLAERHARRACQLAPELADAWATLGFVLERTADHADAVAAIRRALSLEPYNFQHSLRLAFVTWGQEAFLAARRVLDEVPRCLPARWLAARIYVARDQLERAERELDLGLTHADKGVGAGVHFSAVGLNWLKGLLCLARDAGDEAMAAFERELAVDAGGHLYGREMAANAWYAKGACCLRQGDEAAARDGFEQAIARVPAHAMARAGLRLVSGMGAFDAAPPSPLAVDAAMARAVAPVHGGDIAGAALVVETALNSAPPGNAGWLLPLEPLLHVQGDLAAWRTALGLVAVRAV
jgi:DNA-binding winged helix-turn-helix (wHTH) protein/Tfp pilus assembly protein PilF